MQLTKCGQSNFLKNIKQAQERILDPLFKQEPQEKLDPTERAALENPLPETDNQDAMSILDQLLSRVQTAIKGNTPVDLKIIENDLLDLRNRLNASPVEEKKSIEDDISGGPF